MSEGYDYYKDVVQVNKTISYPTSAPPRKHPNRMEGTRFYFDNDDRRFVDIEGTMIRESFAAFYIDFIDCKEWIPKSQIKSCPSVGEKGIIWMTLWIAYKKNLVGKG